MLESPTREKRKSSLATAATAAAAAAATADRSARRVEQKGFENGAVLEVYDGLLQQLGVVGVRCPTLPHRLIVLLEKKWGSEINEGDGLG